MVEMELGLGMSQWPGQSCPKGPKGISVCPPSCLRSFTVGWLGGTSLARNLEPSLTDFLPHSIDLQLELEIFRMNIFCLSTALFQDPLVSWPGY